MNKLTALIATALLATAFAVGPATADDDDDDDDDDGVSSLSEFDTVPNSDPNHPAGTLGDVWEVDVEEDGTFTLRVDTRDDNGNRTSNLDPIMFLLDEEGNIIAAADDNVACTRTQVCGFACPQIGPIALNEGDRIIVRDFNSATLTGTQCNGGAYVLSVSSTDGGLIEELELEKDDKRVGGNYTTNEWVEMLEADEGNPGKYY